LACLALSLSLSFIVLTNPRQIGGGPGGGALAKSHRDSNGDDGDDLPEELKRYGKELVDKITAEIMDSGDPVRFDEIAGLKGVKRTIDEMVCLPMRRPDLFSGLRRAPNGLLLFGPPGTGPLMVFFVGSIVVLDFFSHLALKSHAMSSFSGEQERP
jgi:hypothetical protein